LRAVFLPENATCAQPDFAGVLLTNLFAEIYATTKTVKKDRFGAFAVSSIVRISILQEGLYLRICSRSIVNSSSIKTSSVNRKKQE
jgi:hypothetical protein